MRLLLRVLSAAGVALLGVGTLGMMLAAWAPGALCRVETGAWVSIVSLEAAHTQAELDLAVAACFGDSTESALAHLDADTFLVIPTFVLLVGAWRYARVLRPRWAWRYGVAMTALAGLADLAENAVLRNLLGAPYAFTPELPLPAVTTVKWLMLIAASVTFHGSPWHRIVSASMIAVVPAIALGAVGLSWLTLALGVGWTAFGMLDLAWLAFGQPHRTTR